MEKDVKRSVRSEARIDDDEGGEDQDDGGHPTKKARPPLVSRKPNEQKKHHQDDDDGGDDEAGVKADSSDEKDEAGSASDGSDRQSARQKQSEKQGQLVRQAPDAKTLTMQTQSGGSGSGEKEEGGQAADTEEVRRELRSTDLLGTFLRTFLLALLFIVTFYFCQAFVELYRNESSAAGVQISLTLAFFVPLVVFQTIAKMIAGAIDKTSSATGQTMVIAVMAFEYFLQVFQKYVFTTVKSAVAFGVVIAILFVKDCILYPMRMSRTYSDAVQKLTAMVKNRSVPPEDQILREALAIRKDLGIEFFFVAMAQRTSVGILAFSTWFLRHSYNEKYIFTWSFFFITLGTDDRLRAWPSIYLYLSLLIYIYNYISIYAYRYFRFDELSNEEAFRTYRFIGYILIGEWSGSALLHIIILKAYKIDSVVLGISSIMSSKAMTCVVWIAAHILTDAFIATHSLDFEQWK